MDDIVEYSVIGVNRLLRDIYKLQSEETYGGNYDTVILRIDLESALQSQALTPRQRIFFGLYYFAQLTQQECAQLLGIGKQRISNGIIRGLKNISKTLQGHPVTAIRIAYNGTKIDKGSHFNKWIDGAINNDKMWWNMDDNVFMDINLILGIKKNNTIFSEKDRSIYPVKDFNKLRPRNEVLMSNPKESIPLITFSQRRYQEIMCGLGTNSRDKYLGKISFYVRYPNDMKVKRYGAFWTERV